MNSRLFVSIPGQYFRLVTALGCAVAIVTLVSFSNTPLDTDLKWIIEEVLAQERDPTNSTELSDSQNQSATPSENSEPDSGQVSQAWNYFLKFTSTGAREIVEGYGALRKTFGEELSRIQGENYRDQFEWIQNRVRTDPVGRTFWYLIFAFTVVVAVFILVFLVAIAQRILRIIKSRSYATKHFDKALEAKIQASKCSTETNIEKSIETTRKKVPAKKKPATKYLLAGDLTGTENVLLNAVKRDSHDVASMLYLLCVRALRNDATAYEALFKELNKYDRFRKSAELKHAGEIGRILSPDKFKTARYPAPTNQFQERSRYFDDGTEQVAEFGDISTLLDLALVYLEMKEFGKAAQAIVDLLALGDENQRRQAVKLSKRLRF